MSGDAVRTALEAGVDAYDAARCAEHKQDVVIFGMSAQNKQSITPMIAAAIEAFLRALPDPLRLPGDYGLMQGYIARALAAALAAAKETPDE